MNTEPIWPNGARLALSIVVNVEEGAEMSVADGDSRAEAVDEMGMMVKPGIRNFSNESNYAYGIKAGAPRIMDMLARRNLSKSKLQEKSATKQDQNQYKSMLFLILKY